MSKQYYDDNFGFWDMDDDPWEAQRFYNEVQRKSVKKKCEGCGRMVKILPHYAYCDRCADAREKGMDF